MRHLWLVLVLAACSRAGPDWPVPCAVTAECPSGYHCGLDKHCRSDVPCQIDDDCCLGERCVGLTCQTRTTCSANSPCALPGQACAGSLCIAALCASDQNCKGGTHCWDGRCVAHVPCGGPCSSGEACAVSVDRCVLLHGAQPNCAAGTMRVLKDDDRLKEGCQALPETTHCVGLPDLQEGSYGTPSVVLPMGSTLVVLAYDQTYGDVVLARHDPSPPFKRRDLTVLTGVPENAPVVGSTDGPRGGVALPGPDRGRVLAAAVDSQDRLIAALRDETANSLRYLRLDTQGVHEHVLSAVPGVGEAIALRIDPQDRPAVLTFQPAQGIHGSHLLLLRATTATPNATTDWVTEELDVDPGSPTTAAQAPLADDPQGRGAWLDLARGDDGLWLAAAYSTTEHNLRIYHQALPTGWQHADVPANAIPGGSTDFGRFVSLQAQTDGRAMAVCEDHTRGRLLLVRETDAGFAVRVLDGGDRADGHHRVGADSRLIRHASGGLFVLHQDTRRADLLTLKLSNLDAQPVNTVLQSEAAAGFSPSFCALGSKAWVASSGVLEVLPNGQVRRHVALSGVIWLGE